MTAHRITMPTYPQPWTCTCGTTAPLPLAVTWAAWETSVTTHLRRMADQRPCPDCGTLIHRLGMGRHQATHTRRYTPSGLDEFAPKENP